MSDMLHAPAGAPGDPVFLNVLTEIDIIAHLASNEFRRHLQGGLTQAQYGVLNRLTRLDSPETVTELAAAFQVAQPTMSSTVRKLLDKGLVQIDPDALDARVKRVVLTAQGRKLRDVTVDNLRAFQQQIGDETPSIDWEAILPSLTALRVYLDERRGSANG